jgi:formimidoylglutamate deiminase
MTSITRYFCDHALLPRGWADAVVVEVDATGDIVSVQAGGSPRVAQRLGGWVVPGMPNLHSHAFQRAMAGMAEHAGGAGNDDFWSWRETMYALAARLSPDSLRAVAAQLYSEMLSAGYTSVCEFHYVHHQADGSPYAPVTAMSDALIAAALDTGIGLTLLPTLYQTGGFDGRALAPRQRRFAHDLDGFVAVVETLRTRESAQVAVGLALHSLRAVPEDSLRTVLAAEIARSGPIHIHIAEQLLEVDDCLRERGERPVAWLLDRFDVDPRWCLVHATHLSDDERKAFADSGAVAGLCPTTEANLGDGLFALREWLDVGGAIGIGSDSHISVSPIEELRWLEYGQRLRRLKRNVVADARQPASGRALWTEATVGGAQASGRRIGAIQVGHRADLVALDEALPVLAELRPEQVLDAAIFAGNANPIRHVVCGGRWLVRDGVHESAPRFESDFRQALRALRAT